MNRRIQLLLIIVAMCFTCTAAAAATYTYDKLNRLTKVVYGSGSDGTLSYIEYTYDAAGNITLISSLGNVLYGDVDNNRKVDLADAIMSFQIVTGQSISPPEVRKAAINDDRQIGPEEAIYILRKISE